MGFLSSLTQASFMPHGVCYQWRPDLLWLNVGSDVVIALAYATIPLALVSLVRMREDLRFNWLFWSFAGFILLCGATHAMAVLVVWRPYYYALGLVKLFTAFASVATAVAIWPVLPQIRAIPNYRELEKTRRRLAHAQQIARMGNWEWDVATNEVWWSDQTYRVFGKEPDASELTYDTFLQGVHPDDRATVEEEIRRSFETGAPYELTFRVPVEDGQERVIDAVGEVQRDSAGNVLSVSGVVQDVTERRELEQRLAESQRLEALGRLAGGVAHDFNNMLTGMVGFAELMKMDLDDDHPGQADLQEIVALTVRGRDLTQQLLSFSRQRESKRETLRVDDTVRTIGRLLERVLGEDVHLALDLGAPEALVELDPGQLEQALVNLAVNARDAMPTGGKLTVATRPTAPQGDAVMEATGLSVTGPGTVITVSDTGEGMDEEVMSRIFEPFFTTKESGKGTGLGLAMVHGMVHQHHGDVSVDSELGVGTVFRLYFPDAVVGPAVSAPIVPEAAVDGGDETILLVEDNEEVRQVVGRQLEAKGYEVLQAPNGRVAIEMFERQPNAFDLLVSDVIMPEVDGAVLLSRLREIRPGMPAILMSGYSEQRIDRAQLRDEGAFFLEKPFSANDLLRAVRVALEVGDDD